MNDERLYRHPFNLLTGTTYMTLSDSRKTLRKQINSNFETSSDVLQCTDDRKCVAECGTAYEFSNTFLPRERRKVRWNIHKLLTTKHVEV